MLGHERFELANEGGVESEPEIGAYAVLDRCDPEFQQPGYVGLCEALEGEVRQRWPAPDVERVAQSAGCLLVLSPFQRGPCAGHFGLEVVEVELAGLNSDEVAGWPRDQEPVRFTAGASGF
jgi:hypothetical protein